MEDWRRLWRDPETPPYEVLHIEIADFQPRSPQATGYKLYYRNYRGMRAYYLAATDELGAFVWGTSILKSLKIETDRRRERMK
jgi:hypothetical protein